MSSTRSTLLLSVVLAVFATQAAALSPRRLSVSCPATPLPPTCFTYQCTGNGQVRVTISNDCDWKQIVVIYNTATSGACGPQNCYPLDKWYGKNAFDASCTTSYTLLVRSLSFAGTPLKQLPAVQPNPCLSCGIAEADASAAQWCQAVWRPDCSSTTVSGGVCRPAVGPCDKPEQWTTGCSCPTDEMQPKGTVCRNALGPCDVPETCTGTASTCPDAKWTCNKKGADPKGFTCQKKKLL